MDGIHDLGGKQGFGAVEREENEPVFHERWEAAVFACMLAARGAHAYRNIDQFRHAIERIDPRAYLTHGYYGRWLGGLETLLVESGVFTTEEVDAAHRRAGGLPSDLVAARPATSPDLVDYDAAAPHGFRPLSTEPRFALGARVRTRAHGVPGHTRLPAYARGVEGTIKALHDGWVFPDSNAHGRGESPEHLYTVAFAGEVLWGEAGEAGVLVHVDLFEPYLEALND